MSERMTDLERAYAFMEEHIACQRSICSFVTNCGCAAEIADLIAAARREARNEALEEAAHECDEEAKTSSEGFRDGCETCAAAIRALKDKKR